MNINFSSFKEGSKETISLLPSIDTLNELNHSSIISKINNIEGEVTFSKVNDILIIDFSLKANIDAISAYSLNVINKDIDIIDTLYFTNDKNNETEEVFYTKDIISLEELIYSLLLTSIPLNIHGNDEKLPSGEDFKVYSEDELNEELNNENESPFDCLKDLDL